MDVLEAIWKRRSIRRFQQREIDEKKLIKCVDAARVAPSAANLQPLEYIVVRNPEIRKKIFREIKWAGYLDWNPKEEEAPMAYVAVLKNSNISSNGKYDVGLAVENMVLCGMEEGISSCIIASFDKQKVRKILDIPPHMEIELLVAFGYPAEKSVIEEMEDSIKYYKVNDVLHVPKRKLHDIIHFEHFKEKD
ncbi:MAG: nitroreductase [Thermoplasmata archaeon]|nr:MAG: nitroreductase [Thermoplasmata archaeon]